METDFSSAKVGDRVWDFIYGWGKILPENKRINRELYPIYVQFDSGVCDAYSYDGVNGLGKRTLFWDEIHFEIPPRPKRKVKKVIEGWVDVSILAEILHKTKEDARYHSGISTREPLYIHHEYEVEE